MHIFIYVCMCVCVRVCNQQVSVEWRRNARASHCSALPRVDFPTAASASALELAFSSNHNQAHLIQLIKIFRIARNFQAGVSWLELNCAELRPSRN